MSMKRRIILLAMIVVLPLLLINTTAWRSLTAMPMPAMTHGPMEPSDCLSACGSQLQSSVAVINQREEEKEKEKEPAAAPAEPYYVQFMRFALVAALVSAAYFLRHLHWRPPDLIKLTTAYRF